MATKVTQVMAEAAALDHEAQRDAEVLDGLLRTDKPETPATPPKRRTRSASKAAEANGSGDKPATPAQRTRKTTTATPPAATPPARRTRSASAKPATETKAPAKSAPAKSKTQPAPAPASNGTSAREATQEMARELIDLVAGHFGARSVDDQTKIANWLKVLPTGGAAWERYWPEKFARPTTSDWRKPE